MTSSDFMKEIFSFENEEEKIQFEAETIHLDMMHEIRKLMKESDMNKAELSKRLNTSKGYITQLFTGDRLINMKTLAKIQRIFNVKLVTEFTPKDHFSFDCIAEKNVDYTNVLPFHDLTYDTTSIGTISGQSFQKPEAM